MKPGSQRLFCLFPVGASVSNMIFVYPNTSCVVRLAAKELAGTQGLEFPNDIE